MLRNPSSIWFLMHARPFGFGWDFVQDSRFGMNIKHWPTRIGSNFSNGKFAAGPATSVETPDSSIPHEGVTLHHLEHVHANMSRDDVAWFNYLRCFAVNVVPPSPDVRSQPAFQRPQVLPKPLAARMRSAHPLFFWQEFIRQIGASVLFVAATAVTRFFDDDLVHI